MIAFLFIILIAAIAIIYLYYDNKLMILKRQVLTLTSQYAKLKENCSNSSSSQKVTAIFSTPPATKALLSINTNIYLAPLLNSSILQEASESIEVDVLDSVIIDSSTWFYISLPNYTTNNRGWVVEKNLLFQ